nr:copper resistance protein CopC [Actinoplanes sp. ATCC 53533]
MPRCLSRLRGPSTPGAGSVLGSLPDQITLTFIEAVFAVPGRIQVLAPDGKRISESVAVRGNALTVHLRRADQTLGTIRCARYQRPCRIGGASP